MSRIVPMPRRMAKPANLRAQRGPVAGNATFALNDDIILFDTTAGNRTAQLPAANAVPAGTSYEGVNVVGANNVNLTPAGADTVDAGGAFAITPALKSVAVTSDGVSNWNTTIGGI